MKTTLVVMDTNVLVAALRSRQGASYRLLMALPDGHYLPNISVPLFLEYESVLKRDGMVSNLSIQEIDDILDYMLSKSVQRTIYFLWRPFLRDPKDDLVLELAVEARCSHIITFNKKDFQGAEKFGLSVVTPQEFMIEKGMLP